MEDIEIRTEHSNIEEMLSEVKNRMQKPGNIYSRFQCKERELCLLKEKYNECSKTLIEYRGQIEHLQHMLFLQKTETIADQQKHEKEPTKGRSSQSKVRTVTDSAVRPSTLEVDDAKPLSHSRFSLPADVDQDGEVLLVQGSVSLGAETKVGAMKNNWSVPCEPAERRSRMITEETVTVTDRTDMALHNNTGLKSSNKLISEDLLQKVMHQNMRLKQVLREVIMDLHGETVQDYLEKHDYADVVNQQRVEITGLKGRLSELDSIIGSSNNDLQKKCAQLASKVHSLEHAATVRQAIVDVYSAECNRLREQVQTVSGDNVKQLSAAETFQLVKQIMDDLRQLKTKYAEMEVYYKAAQAVSAAKIQELDSERQKKDCELHKTKTDLQKSEESLAQALQAIDQISATSELKPEVDACGSVLCQHAALSQNDVATDGGEEQTTADSSLLTCARCDKQCSDEEALRKHRIKCTDD